MTKYGNLITDTDPKGSTITYEYAPAGWKSAQVTPNGTRTEFGYDSSGRPVKTEVKCGQGETSGISYDTEGRKIAEVTPQQYYTGVQYNIILL